MKKLNLKKIAKFFGVVFVISCIMAGIVFLMEYYMFQTLELILALVAGLGIPFAFITRHWSKYSRPHVSAYWIMQSLLLFTAYFICAPTIIHGAMEGASLLWKSLADYAVIVGGVSLLSSGILCLVHVCKEWGWHLLWKRASRKMVGVNAKLDSLSNGEGVSFI